MSCTPRQRLDRAFRRLSSRKNLWSCKPGAPGSIAAGELRALAGGSRGVLTWDPAELEAAFDEQGKPRGPCTMRWASSDAAGGTCRLQAVLAAARVFPAFARHQVEGEGTFVIDPDSFGGRPPVYRALRALRLLRRRGYVAEPAWADTPQNGWDDAREALGEGPETAVFWTFQDHERAFGPKGELEGPLSLRSKGDARLVEQAFARFGLEARGAGDEGSVVTVGPGLRPRVRLWSAALGELLVSLWKRGRPSLLWRRVYGEGGMDEALERAFARCRDGQMLLSLATFYAPPEALVRAGLAAIGSVAPLVESASPDLARSLSAVRSLADGSTSAADAASRLAEALAPVNGPPGFSRLPAPERRAVAAVAALAELVRHGSPHGAWTLAAEVLDAWVASGRIAPWKQGTGPHPGWAPLARLVRPALPAPTFDVLVEQAAARRDDLRLTVLGDFSPRLGRGPARPGHRAC